MALGVDTVNPTKSVNWSTLDTWWTGNPSPSTFIGRYFGPSTSQYLWQAGESSVQAAQAPDAPQYVIPLQATGTAVQSQQTATGPTGFANGRQHAQQICDGITDALTSGDLLPSANYGVIRVYLDIEPQGLALSTDYWNGWASYLYNHVHIYTDPATGVRKPLQLWQPCIYCFSNENVGAASPPPYGPDSGVASALSPANSLAAPCYGFYFTRSASVGSKNSNFKFNPQIATEASLQSIMTTCFPSWPQPDMDGQPLMNVHVVMWQYLIDQDFGDGAQDTVDLDVSNEPTQQPPTNFMLRMP